MTMVTEAGDDAMPASRLARARGHKKPAASAAGPMRWVSCQS